MRPQLRILTGLCAVTTATSALGAPASATSAVPYPPNYYVAMGSSYAAGPGITKAADTAPFRCFQSRDNFAHIFARQRVIPVTDVSCSGAKTDHILSAWKELPPQIEAVTDATRLVTITIGGNDLSYIGRLVQLSCTNLTNNPAQSALYQGCATAPVAPALADKALEQKMLDIATNVRSRAPKARLIFVNYLSVLPSGALCKEAPVSKDEAKAIRAIASRLRSITARAARKGGAFVLDAASLSRNHSVCNANAWMRGFPPPAGQNVFLGYHPNLAGMTAIANRLDAIAPR